MSTRNKSLLLFVLMVIMSLTMTACTRERFRQNRTDVPVTAPAPTLPATALPDSETAQPTQVSTPAGAPTVAPDISQDLQELEALLGELDQILGGTDTEVKVP